MSESRSKIIDHVKPGDRIVFTEDGIRRVDDPDAHADGVVTQDWRFDEPVIISRDPETNAASALFTMRFR